jgi:hypothetical protein
MTVGLVRVDGLTGDDERERYRDPGWSRGRPVALSGVPEVLRVIDQATRGGGERRKRRSLVAINTPTTRPSLVCPQATSSHRPPATIPQLLALLHDPLRFPLHLVMVLRSLHGSLASPITELSAPIPPPWLDPARQP